MNRIEFIIENLITKRATTKRTPSPDGFTVNYSKHFKKK